ncbi:hypothetical protein BH09ACT8_BH09ACT8_63570 [soil metagenome]
MPDGKPNILVIWGDDIGITNLSCYSDGMMGYRTPNIDRIASEGMRFTDSYGEQSCTAGRAAFISGQSVYRTGMSKVGMPGVDIGWATEDPTIAELLKPLGYATGQFGKNHFGDLNKCLPTVHGFDEFYGNLYHLNAEEEPETDPFEYADITSNTYYEWFLRRDFFVIYATAMASAFLDTFREFPPRHEPASFSVDQIVKKLEDFLAAD